MSESVIKITSFSLILGERYIPISTIHFVPNPFLVAATFPTWAPLKNVKDARVRSTTLISCRLQEKG